MTIDVIPPDAIVLVDGANCGTVGKFGSAAYFDVKCTKSLFGSHVLVYLKTSDTVKQFIVCEIEVYEGLNNIFL
jgi:hypothetical protein